MPANLIKRQVSSKVFLQILNMQPFRSLLQIFGSEYVAEYEIVNNTLKVKLIDKLKLEKFKRGHLKKQTNLTGNRFALGRFNTVQIAKVINLLNTNGTLKARFGLKNDEKIQTIQGYGSTSVVVQAYNITEVQNQQEQEQIESRSNYGVRVQTPRGNR